MWTIYPPGELLDLRHAPTVFTFSGRAAVRGIYTEGGWNGGY